jgi:hypothetical protein
VIQARKGDLSLWIVSQWIVNLFVVFAVHWGRA